MKEIKKYLAEFIGTCVLVLLACGVAGQICATGVSGLIGWKKSIRQSYRQYGILVKVVPCG